MNVFAAVRDSLNISEVARDFGVHVVGRSKAHCPFHEDHDPSMSFWKNNKKFTCFSGACGVHGDVIDLVGRLENLESLDAAQLLNDYYHLNIPFDQPSDFDWAAYHAANRRRLEQQERREALEEWSQDAYAALLRYVRLMNDWRSIYVPLHPDLPLPSRYIEASSSTVDYIGYLLDRMDTNRGDMVKMAEFYIVQREFIEKIRRKLNEVTEPDVGRTDENPAPVAGNGAVYLLPSALTVQAL